MCRKGLAEMSSRVQENLSGIHVVRAYAGEAGETAAFAALNERFKAQSMELARVRGQMMPIMKTAASLGTLVVLWYGGVEVIDGRLSLGDLVAFIGYLNLLAWPTMAMGWMLSILQRGRAAMQRLEHIFGIEPEIRDAPDAVPLPAVRGAVEFRNVDFAYRVAGNGHQVLHGVSFRIEPGQKLALVGRTGSGKSTVATLLPRLFDVSGGHDPASTDATFARCRWRSCGAASAFVPQDPFLFSTTVRDNIRFGVDGADDAAVRRAAAVAGVADDIEAFPRGYDTVVGERGITLSGGQKQRLTLARAVLADPPILVLDDALSSVDTRTERAILQALENVMRDRTAIIIAHRISTIQDADLIAVVDDGHIVELGDHADPARARRPLRRPLPPATSRRGDRRAMTATGATPSRRTATRRRHGRRGGPREGVRCTPHPPSVDLHSAVPPRLLAGDGVPAGNVRVRSGTTLPAEDDHRPLHQPRRYRRRCSDGRCCTLSP